MSGRIPIAVMPNVYFKDRISHGKVSIRSRTDPAVRAAIMMQPMLGLFLESFYNEFGLKVNPSVIMLRSDSPDSLYTAEAISGFRDALSIAIITRTRADIISGDAAIYGAVWSNSFSMYPWMLDKPGEALTVNTPSLMGTNNVKSFHGQSMPGLKVAEISKIDLDTPLLDLLMDRWVRRFACDTPEWEDRAIFRSLNMAYHASMMPGGQEATFYDVGRLITMWVSAMEILIHSGSSQSVRKSDVQDLLDGCKWVDIRLGKLSKDFLGEKRSADARTIASHLYFKIDQLRSDFVHGNEVEPGKLTSDSGLDYLHIAASLYRMALAQKVGVTAPSVDKGDFGPQFVKDFCVYSDWRRAQVRHEEIILKAANLSPIL